jgi:hypothetical protein
MEPLYAAVTSLMDVPLEDVTEGPLDELALRYDALRRIQGMAKVLSDAVELQLIEAMPADTFDVPMLGRVRRIEKRSRRVGPGGTSRLHRDLALAVAKSVGTDPYTGEINDVRRDAAREAVRVTTDVCTISATALKQNARELIGLEPDEYVAIGSTYAIVMEVEDEVV